MSAEIFDSIEGLKVIEIKSDQNDSPQRKKSKQMSNSQARNYVIGFVGKKLGLQPKKNPNPDSWIKIKGKGRLFEPSDDLVEICEVCENRFEEINGSGVSLGDNPLGGIIKSIMSEFPSFPKPVVTLFCKTKFFGRIRQLNNDLKLQKLNNSVRVFKQKAQFAN